MRHHNFLIWRNLTISRDILFQKCLQIYSFEMVQLGLGFLVSPLHPDKSPFVVDNPGWLQGHLWAVSPEELQLLGSHPCLCNVQDPVLSQAQLPPTATPCLNIWISVTPLKQFPASSRLISQLPGNKFST